jgi:hypothetical protein
MCIQEQTIKQAFKEIPAMYDNRSINDHHDITEILLEVALSTIFPLRIIIIYVQLSVVDRQ